MKRLIVLTWDSNCFLSIFSFALIGYCDYCGFILQHSIEMHSLSIINHNFSSNLLCQDPENAAVSIAWITGDGWQLFEAQ